MTINFERTKNPKESLCIGTITEIKKQLDKVKGALVPYEDYISMNLCKYTDNYKVCVVLHPDGHGIIMTRSKNEWRKNISDILDFLKNKETELDLQVSSAKSARNAMMKSMMNNTKAEHNIW